MFKGRMCNKVNGGALNPQSPVLPVQSCQPRKADVPCSPPLTAPGSPDVGHFLLSSLMDRAIGAKRDAWGHPAQLCWGRPGTQCYPWGLVLFRELRSEHGH